MGTRSYGIDPVVADQIASEVAEVSRLGIELAVVIGGGNIFRGLAASAKGMDRATADNMGMLATVMNSLALSDALERHGSRRTLHQTPRHTSSEEGARRPVRGRHRQPVLHDGHGGGAPRHGDPCRRHHESHEGRRYLHVRSSD